VWRGCASTGSRPATGSSKLIAIGQRVGRIRSARICPEKALVASEFVSRAIYERADTDVKVSRQRIASIEQQIASTVVALNGNPNIEVDSHPSVREAKAQLDEAQLYLSYATVYAPDDGIVAKVDDLQVGNYVNNGAPAFALISDHEIWVEANFAKRKSPICAPARKRPYASTPTLITCSRPMSPA
jgi:membrane fusion protein (multidrug efflux system)